MQTKRCKNTDSGWSAGNVTKAEPCYARAAQGSAEDAAGPDRVAMSGS